MAGFKIRRRQQAQIEELGEDHIFATYIQTRSVRKLLEAIGIPNGHQALYDWLHGRGEDSDPDRWQRWQDTRKIVADRAVDNIVETVESVTPDNAAASRVRLDGEKWLAAMHNREAYGNSRDAALVVGTPGMWLEAIAKVAQAAQGDREILIED